LSAYDLSKDKLFLDKAVELADRLIPAFHENSSMPHTEVNLRTGAFRNSEWHKTTSILSEVGSIQLEFKYLSHVTGDMKYWDIAQNIMQVLDKQKKRHSGLYSVYISTNEGTIMGDHITLGALGDSFYEYLLKQWLLTGEEQFHRMYREFIQGLKDKLIAKSTPNNFVYIREMKGGRPMAKFDHLVCFAVGI